MKNKILNFLKKDKFVSGEKLAKELKVSRTAIWKQINSLKKNGYKIEAVKNKGYKIISKPDLLLPEEIDSGLNTKIVGKKIIYFKEVDSTNSYCKKLIKKNIEEGTVVVADIQKKGRGRKNRSWFSPDGGIWFSMILKPNISPMNAMIITMATSISLVEAINESSGLECVIKWPNDVLIKGKKVCGVLTELESEMDKINYAIVGVGINVNNTVDKDLQKIATSIKDELNKKISRVELFKNILNNFDEKYGFVKNFDFEKIRALWFKHSNIVGKNIKVIQLNREIKGRVVDIDEAGCLIVDTGKKLEKIVSGDVVYL